jgi:hypothetical protein
MLFTRKELMKIFLFAIKNEIAIDKNYIERTQTRLKNYGFTPIRPAKSLKYIEKYHLSNKAYGLTAILFALISPLYFLTRFLVNIKISKHSLKKNSYKQIVLMANSRMEYLAKKNHLIENSFLININQKNNEFHSIHNFLNLADHAYSYLNSILSVLYLLFTLNEKKDILQCYVAYEWFLAYQALTKIKGIENVFYSNHYDRWTVLFDHIFSNKHNTLVQHGILPNDLDLPYKIKNINTIFILNEESKKSFKEIFDLKETKFLNQNTILELIDIEKTKPTILIIGQPHSINREIELGKLLAEKYQLLIKPHPLYDDSKYYSIENATLIKDKDFYPKTDVALCYESTLGLEYESSGVNVIWWKELDNKTILEKINLLLIAQSQLEFS